MDDFLILLQAKLDEAKSKGNVNADIEKFQGQLDKLKIQVTLDPKSAQNLADEIGKLVNQKIVISNIGIDTNSAVKSVQQAGKQMSSALNKEMSSTTSVTDKVLRDFSELNDAKRKFVDGHDLISKDDISDAEKLYDTVRKAFSEFGQVTVSKGSMNDGSLENMRVKIEQVNGEMKITRDFMLYFNESKNGFKLVDDDTIRTTEKMIQHLNEEKNIINATNEEANAIKAKLVEQEKYYKNIQNEVNTLYNLKTKLLSADELQTAELEKQIKQTKERISYNNKQIDKKDLRDNSLDRQINDLEVAKQKQLDLASAKSQDALNTKELAQAEREAATALKERQAIEKQVNEIQLSIDNGDYDTQLLSYETALQKLGLSSQEVTEKMKGVTSVYEELKTSATGDNIIPDDAVSKAKTLETEMSKLDNTVKQIKLKDSLQADDLQVEQTILRLNKQLIDNSKYSKDAKDKIRSWVSELEKGGTASARLKQINVEAKELHANMVAINKSGKGFFETLKSKMGSLGSYLSASAILGTIFQTIKTGISDVKGLDTALVDLKKTAKMSASELYNFYLSANDTAKQMGVTTQTIIEQASAWSRLGFNTADAATKMAKYSSMFATISPGMDLDSATDGLVSVMKAFKIGLEDTDEVVDGIMSKINIIGNTQAINNSDIVDFLRRSSSAMAEANNTLEDTIALGTAMVEITRDSAGAGQVLKTVSMRVRGYDEDTEEFIGGVEELSGKIADLTKTASTPGGISLFTDEAKTEFKSTRQLLQEISEIYDQLTDKNQAELLEALAGKRNGQAVAAILNNFDTVTSSLESMADSAGNAEAEMSIAMDSIDYKLNKVKETGTGIAQNLFGRDDIKLILDNISSIGSGLDWLTKKLGLFGTINAGTGLFASFKNVGMA